MSTADAQERMVTAVFRTPLDAQTAYEQLLARGYAVKEISVLMSDSTRTQLHAEHESSSEAGSLAVEGMGVGGAIGTAVGATIAALAAVGTSMVVPGLGLVIAGPIAAALAGGGAGAVTGGIVGALVGYGIPEPDAAAYQDALRNGGVVMGVVPRDSDQADEVKDVFRANHGVSICYT
ncbi:MAG: hypothetical protein U0736_23485 [Gemmataceae bacterium]